jgi:hypothetical protein
VRSRSAVAVLGRVEIRGLSALRIERRAIRSRRSREPRILLPDLGDSRLHVTLPLRNRDGRAGGGVGVGGGRGRGGGGGERLLAFRRPRAQLTHPAERRNIEPGISNSRKSRNSRSLAVIGKPVRGGLVRYGERKSAPAKREKEKG